MNPDGIYAQARIYSVWVGGGEVNDYLLTWSDAHELATEYRNAGYDDVAITSRDKA